MIESFRPKKIKEEVEATTTPENIPNQAEQNTQEEQLAKQNTQEEQLDKENTQKAQLLGTKLGSLLHDEWRASRIQEDGTFEPRIKTTNDVDWIEKNGGVNQVDIANTSYEFLPEDWKGENKISAEITMQLISEAVEQRLELNDEFVEKASSHLHDKWLERNGDWAPEEQKLPYEQLSEEEKEKDRVIIKKGIELYNTEN